MDDFDKLFDIPVDITISSVKGDKGDRGRRGESGLSIKGDKGDKGDKGENGIDGKDGKNGKNGKNGINGIDGKDGISIDETSLTEDGELIISKSDGARFNLGVIKGRDGNNGHVWGYTNLTAVYPLILPEPHDFISIDSAGLGVLSITGTTNQINVDNTHPQNPILSTPQNINSGATPTFTGTNFTGIPEAGVINLVSDLAGKQPVGNYITALTGDGTANGPGNVSLTLTTVNSNIGTFGDATHVGQLTVNSKGLITAVSNVLITGTAPGGTAGGDLSGTYPNPTVAKINGISLGTTTATAGNILIGSGTAWVTNAINGDITLSSSGAAAIGNNKVTDAILRQSAATSIIGRSANSSGNVADISATVNQTVLRRNSSGVLGFGALTISDSNAVTGILPIGNGGTGTAATLSQGSLIYAGGVGVYDGITAVGTGNVLLSAGTTTVPTWGKVDLTSVVTGILPLANGGTNANLTASNGGVFYSTASAAAISAVGNAGQVFQANGAAAPTWSTPTYPSASGTAGKILRSDGTNNVYTTSTFADTYAVSRLLYASSANTITGLATANSSLLVTDSGGIPSLSTNIPTAVTIGSAYIYRVGGTVVSLADGGTAANLTANTGGIVYSGASALAILAGTATASKMLLSGSTAAPTWSTSTIPTSAGSTANKLLLSDGTNYVLSAITYPNASVTTGKIPISDGTNYIASTSIWPNTVGTAGKIIRSDGTVNTYTTSTFADTYTASNLLYSNGSNTIAGLATGNNGVLITSGSGVPSISSTIPNATQLNITALGTIATGVWQGTVIDGTYINYNTTNLKVTSSKLNTIQDIATSSTVQHAKLGLGVAAINALDVNGGIATGSYAGVNTPATGGMLVAGQTIFGSSSSFINARVEIQGSDRITFGMGGTKTATDGSSQACFYVGPTYAPTSSTSVVTNFLMYPQFNPPTGVTITTAYGMYLQTGGQAGLGSVTTGYNLYIEVPSFGSTQIAAYLGNLAVGYTGIAPPSAGLIVSGNTSVGASSNTYKLDVTGGHIGIMSAGNTLRIKQGSNACMGTGATMVAGIVTVSTTAVATGDLIITSRTASGGTLGSGDPLIAISNGTSFTLTSQITVAGSPVTNTLETSTFSWIILKAA